MNDNFLDKKQIQIETQVWWMNRGFYSELVVKLINIAATYKVVIIAPIAIKFVAILEVVCGGIYLVNKYNLWSSHNKAIDELNKIQEEKQSLVLKINKYTEELEDKYVFKHEQKELKFFGTLLNPWKTHEIVKTYELLEGGKNHVHELQEKLQLLQDNKLEELRKQINLLEEQVQKLEDKQPHELEEKTKEQIEILQKQVEAIQEEKKELQIQNTQEEKQGVQIHSAQEEIVEECEVAHKTDDVKLLTSNTHLS